MEIALTLLVVAAAAFAIRTIIKTNPAQPMVLPPMPATPYEPRLPAGPACALHWSDDGRYLVEVMTESRYQPALKELAGEHGDQAAAVPYLARWYPMM
jgi:hypothetical protein